VLYNFTGDGDGGNPIGLILSGDGNLYGITTQGGSSQDLNPAGTLFKLTAAGTFTTLFTFPGELEAGGEPSTLIEGSDGNFYVTTDSTGLGEGNGSVLKITSAGASTVLCGFPNDSFPRSLVKGSDGALYGLADDDCAGNHPERFGVVYKATSSGVFTTLYAFTGTSDGNNPRNLIEGRDGNLYGTTLRGGAGGGGTVFKLTSAGVLTTLYSFAGGTNFIAFGPFNFIGSSDGNFYGTRAFSDNNGNDFGTVFELTPEGVYTTLYSYSGADSSVQTLLEGTDGNLYGTTVSVLSAGSDPGTLFRLTPAGVYTTLHSFAPGRDGSSPVSLVLSSDGTLYGTTRSGGLHGYGTVFKFD
jgi:uncharacterized repeat protein (TIGR03803 family)